MRERDSSLAFRMTLGTQNSALDCAARSPILNNSSSFPPSKLHSSNSLILEFFFLWRRIPMAGYEIIEKTSLHSHKLCERILDEHETHEIFCLSSHVILNASEESQTRKAQKTLLRSIPSVFDYFRQKIYV